MQLTSNCSLSKIFVDPHLQMASFIINEFEKIYNTTGYHFDRPLSLSHRLEQSHPKVPKGVVRIAEQEIDVRACFNLDLNFLFWTYKTGNYTEATNLVTKCLV